MTFDEWDAYPNDKVVFRILQEEYYSGMVLLRAKGKPLSKPAKSCGILLKRIYKPQHLKPFSLTGLEMFPFWNFGVPIRILFITNIIVSYF